MPNAKADPNVDPNAAPALPAFVKTLDAHPGRLFADTRDLKKDTSRLSRWATPEIVLASMAAFRESAYTKGTLRPVVVDRDGRYVDGTRRGGCVIEAGTNGTESERAEWGDYLIPIEVIDTPASALEARWLSGEYNRLDEAGNLPPRSFESDTELPDTISVHIEHKRVLEAVEDKNRLATVERTIYARYPHYFNLTVDTSTGNFKKNNAVQDMAYAVLAVLDGASVDLGRAKLAMLSRSHFTEVPVTARSIMLGKIAASKYSEVKKIVADAGGTTASEQLRKSAKDDTTGSGVETGGQVLNGNPPESASAAGVHAVAEPPEMHIENMLFQWLEHCPISEEVVENEHAMAAISRDEPTRRHIVRVAQIINTLHAALNAHMQLNIELKDKDAA